MKKISIIALCLVLFLSFATVGASAADYADGNGSTATAHLYGVWKWNRTIHFDSLTDFNYDVVFRTVGFGSESGDATLYGDYYRMTIGKWMQTRDALIYVSQAPNVSDPNYYAYNITEDTWVYGEESRARYLYFDNIYVSDDFYNWFTANATESLCDGSLCPVGDSNADGYCDECFKRMTTVAETYPVYPSDLPAPPYIGGTYEREIIIFDDDGVTKLYSYITSGKADNYYVWGNSNNQEVILEATGPTSEGSGFKLVNGQWEYSGVVSGDYTLCTKDDIIYSSVTIQDQNGDDFFPLALWHRILLVTRGAMKAEIPNLVGSISILAILGITLMALLICLPLFGKVLRRFL